MNLALPVHNFARLCLGIRPLFARSARTPLAPTPPLPTHAPGAVHTPHTSDDGTTRGLAQHRDPRLARAAPPLPRARTPRHDQHVRPRHGAAGADPRAAKPGRGREGRVVAGAVAAAIAFAVARRCSRAVRRRDGRGTGAALLPGARALQARTRGRVLLRVPCATRRIRAALVDDAAAKGGLLRRLRRGRRGRRVRLGAQ